MPDVLELTIDPGLLCLSTLAKSSRLIRRFSTTASITQSTPETFARSSSKLPVFTSPASEGAKKAAGLLSGRQLLRGDVEKQDFDPCIREMRGYLRAHRSRAQHSHSINLVTHFLSSVIAPIPPPLAF